LNSEEVGLRSIGTLRFTREIRDPIYGYIHITNFENDIIDSNIFQRLGRIHQMPTAHMAYPSGTYSRKTHSLGVMHLVHRAMLHILYLHSPGIQRRISPLFFGRPVVIKEDKDRYVQHLDQEIGSEWWDKKNLESIMQYSRIAALLHDIGHAPFSHTFEEASSFLFDERLVTRRFDHEAAGREVITSMAKDLKIKEPFDQEQVVDLLTEKGKSPAFIRDIISGPFDCDKLDYLMRDAHHLGTPEYGNIDCERIIDGMRVKESKLCISSSSLHALMNSFRAIQSMYTAIYYHRTSRIFDFMIQDALCQIPDLVEEISTSVKNLVKYDDSSIICEIRKRSRRRNETAKNYREAYMFLENVLERKKKYKCILEYPVMFPIGMERDAEAQLEEIKPIITDRLSFHGSTLRVDFRPTIRPIGIDLHNIRDWLRSKVIYAEDGELRSLREISKAYHDELCQYIIILRVFIDRESYETYENTIKERMSDIKDEIVSKLYD
jgi:HD superfamily phosphohydrolase